MQGFARRPFVQIALGVATSVAIATVWLYSDLTISLLPAILSAVWIPIVAARRDAKPVDDRLLRVLMGLLLVSVTALIAMYLTVR